MKDKADYERECLFPLTEAQFRKITLEAYAKEVKKDSEWRLKIDKKDKYGDGVPALVGYDLSSVWSRIRHQQCEFYNHVIDLPKIPPEKSLSGGMYNEGMKYSRTNLEEIRRIIKTYMREGDYFLENTCGWSTFGCMAAYYGYDGIGCDIWDTAIEFSKRQYDAISHLADTGKYKVIDADGMNLPFKDNTFDYIYCNPPFMDIELYSGKSNDIADKNEDLFLTKLKNLIIENYRVLKPKNMCTMTISDHRKKGRLIPLQSHLIQISLECGFSLHDIAISESSRGKSMIMRKVSFEKRRCAKTHEYVITFQK